MHLVLFVFALSDPKLEWENLWQIKPLIVTPLVTTCGGLAYYWINNFFTRNSWNKFLGGLLGFITYFVSLWMGLVLGLMGTLWD